MATITPPLAARLGLSAPVWPVTGDFIDAKLYVIDSTGTAFVLVARRPQDVLDRYALTLVQRRELAMAIDRGNALFAMRPGHDASSTIVSEPVRGSFVVHQTLLGGLVFGPAAALLFDQGAAASAAYLAVTGTTFFLAANLTQTTPVSRAQNHLSWHSARRGAIASGLLTYAIAGDGPDRVGFATAGLVGGIAGDVIGFRLGEPMTDAEAHGTSHGSSVTGLVTAGLLGGLGAYKNEGSARAASAAIVGMGALGYPLGLRYVRSAPYSVTSGDIGALLPAEYIGMAAVSAFLPDRASPQAVYGTLAAGFALGAVAGDRMLVRPFDHTEAEARLVEYGTAAGALVALAVPVLAKSNNHLAFGAGAIGGMLGMVLTEQMIQPHRVKSGFGDARKAETRRTGGVDVRVTPEGLAFAGLGLRGNHSLLSVTF
ncbi:MAG: hypothetical protein ABIY52_12620 [Gemmatimonadaceae bacterium]